MRKTTRKIMRNVNTKLTKLLMAEATHCGHEGAVQDCIYQRLRLEEYLRDELDVLCEKAGLE